MDHVLNDELTVTELADLSLHSSIFAALGHRHIVRLEVPLLLHTGFAAGQATELTVRVIQVLHVLPRIAACGASFCILVGLLGDGLAHEEDWLLLIKYMHAIPNHELLRRTD